MALKDRCKEYYSNYETCRNAWFDGIAEDYDEEDEDDDWEEDDDDCYFEVTCPSCGDTIQLNGEMLEEGSIECPNCGENLEFDLDEEECGCGEDCNCEEKE